MKIWSTKEAAQKLGISERRVRKLLAEGRIKGKKLNHAWVVLELAYTKKRGGESMSSPSMTKANIERVGAESHFRCKKCGQEWSPNLLSGGKLPKGWWKCPRGCNSSLK